MLAREETLPPKPTPPRDPSGPLASPPPEAGARERVASGQKLSALDAAFLYFERSNQHMAVGCVAETDGRIDATALTALIEERLCSIPRYRQRPVRATLDVDRPTWESDPAFDLAHHVRHVALPAPGGPRELHALVDQLFATAFDPAHPLWETYLIDGLADGRAAVLCKMHHCMIDGVSGAQLLTVLTDPAAPATTDTAASDGAPPGLARAGVPAPSGAGPGGLLASLWYALGPGALQLGRDLGCAITTIRSLVTEPSTPLPFNGSLSGRRHVVWSDVSLDDVMAVRSAAGCKVNDVVLAIIAGALHRYLESHEVPSRQARVRAIVPVSVRAASDRLSLGNLVTAMLPTLPVGPEEPLDRLCHVAAEMASLKERGQARAAGLVLAMASALPTPIEAAIGRFTPEWPIANTICTNVPGPPDERTILGRRITAIHPIVPLFQGMGLEFGVMSYAGRLSIAAVADGKLVGDPELIREAIAESAQQLFAAHRARLDGAAVASREPRVRDIMTRDVATVRPGDSLLAAHRVLQERRIRHLPVVDERAHLIGILTQRDLIAAQRSTLAVPSSEARSRDLAHSEVAEAMEPHVSTAFEDEPAARAGLRMARQKIGCLPVVSREGRVLGIVTSDDFLHWAAATMQQSAQGAA